MYKNNYKRIRIIARSKKTGKCQYGISFGKEHNHLIGRRIIKLEVDKENKRIILHLEEAKE